MLETDQGVFCFWKRSCWKKPLFTFWVTKDKQRPPPCQTSTWSLIEKYKLYACNWTAVIKLVPARPHWCKYKPVPALCSLLTPTQLFYKSTSQFVCWICPSNSRKAFAVWFKRSVICLVSIVRIIRISLRPIRGATLAASNVAVSIACERLKASRFSNAAAIVSCSPILATAFRWLIAMTNWANSWFVVS